MIENDEQFQVAKRALDPLRKAWREFDVEAAARRCGSRELALAERAALEAQWLELWEQCRDYVMQS